MARSGRPGWVCEWDVVRGAHASLSRPLAMLAQAAAGTAPARAGFRGLARILVWTGRALAPGLRWWLPPRGRCRARALQRGALAQLATAHRDRPGRGDRAVRTS